MFLKKRVLLVEDDPDYYKDLVNDLRSAGYDVVLAKTIEDAIVQLYTQHFHFAVIDRKMPFHRRGSKAIFKPIVRDGMYGDLLFKALRYGLVEAERNAELSDTLSQDTEGVLSHCITRIGLSEHDPRADTIPDWQVYNFISKMTISVSLPKRLLRILDVAYKPKSESQLLAAHIFHNIKLDLEYEFGCEQLLEDMTDGLLKEEGELRVPLEGRERLKAILGEEPPLPREAILSQLQDLISVLFEDDQKIFLTSLKSGLSGASVLRARPTAANETGGLVIRGNFVVKAGQRQKVETEKHNYDRYVRALLTTGCVTEAKYAVRRDVGAIVYNFVQNESQDELPELDVHYLNQDVPPAVLVESLRRLFFNTLRPWYRDRVESLVHHDIVTEYLNAFNLTWERFNERMREVEDDYQPDAPEMVWFADKRTFLIDNPQFWIKAHKNWCRLPSRRAPTHGDLTGRNIIADLQSYEANSQAYYRLWLIDFYRTGVSHILRDVVILETDIKYRLLDAEIGEFVQLERKLLNPQLDVPLTRNTLRAYEVISGLRKLGGELLGTRAGEQLNNHAQIEYMLSLLMATLNIVRLNHIDKNENGEEIPGKPKKHCALLSAALLCRRIEAIQEHRTRNQEPDWVTQWTEE